ncbi:hypothetical protein [Edaphobacter dinghuensis]|uniref:Uncharacterized protein n=1 Tax=Edaphobacter dinghuensis TaxID=1560005 RepID=A0A917M5Y8_9BACT|nr:hypothetical protein [Edaphobacter dinghuensis]GGG81126.1 hypothetical protein GCM10011585_25730 [Edaphobacter dinghuensis]
MHIHGHPMTFNAVDLSSTRAAEKAASAQRAADVRGQLLRSGLDTEGEVNSFESFMVDKEWERGSRQQPSQNRRREPANGRQPQPTEQEADEPLSFWA